jgi:hypothetical protein
MRGHTTARTQRLPDGGTLRLLEVALTATNYNYAYRPGGRIVELLRPVLPPFILKRFNGGGGFGFGIEGDTNLIAITLHRAAPAPPKSMTAIARLRISDDAGNIYDACWGAHTLGFMDETVNGWQIRAFPRRSPYLKLLFMTEFQDGTWATAGLFQIRNPLFREYPQWTPEGLPATKADGNVAATLDEFTSGETMSRRNGSGDEATRARKTRLLFSFAENGRPSDQWRVQKLTISDATGNHWSPYLNLLDQQFTWAWGGVVEVFGALWPGEQAWKVEVEASRTGGFAPEELHEFTMTLPAPGTISVLTKQWEHDGLTLNLDALASPNKDHPGDFQWIGKWWGEDKDKTYSLALHLESDLKGRRLTVVRAQDQEGTGVKVLEHRNQDYSKQAVFLKPGQNATTLGITFAIQRSRFFTFVARPAFANARTNTTWKASPQ